jgi:large subunit ribosomal protein L4
MPTAKIYNLNGEVTAEVELTGALFQTKPHEDLVHRYVKIFLFNQRQGTHKTKGRSEVEGGRTKPWRQKGTGRARAGTTRSPIFRGGGRVFGPEPNYRRVTLPRKMKQAAFRSVRSHRAGIGKVSILDGQLPELKTKIMAGFISALPQEKHFLLVAANPMMHAAGRNIENLAIRCVEEVNTYDLIHSDHVILQKEAMEQLQKRYSL